MLEILLEIFIVDPYYWKRGKSDKPDSTIIYSMLIIGMAVIVQFVFEDNYALSYLVLVWTIRVAFFNYIVNYSTVGKERKPAFYLSNKGTDKILRKVPLEVRVFGEFWLIMVGVLQYLYLSGRIYQEYSMLGLEPFK